MSKKSSHAWHRAWRAGALALWAKGPSASSCRLTEQQMALLEYGLDADPAAAHGWAEDQRWMLAR
ncbi:hypothetical protein [Nonomuraea antri]|uniref:hypothetical protein n=1 Tax=Nonomuraea antri TaxID=2730852 RepID=UPI001C2C3ED9|nr:hypothetical protein [Nonomuraea antri]